MQYLASNADWMKITIMQIEVNYFSFDDISCVALPNDATGLSAVCTKMYDESDDFDLKFEISHF